MTVVVVTSWMDPRNDNVAFDVDGWFTGAVTYAELRSEPMPAAEYAPHVPGRPAQIRLAPGEVLMRDLVMRKLAPASWLSMPSHDRAAIA